MPTYEYVCEKCGNQFEKFQPMAAAPLKVCPQDLCAQKKWGKGKVRRAISGGAGLIFKGSGFYITDYRSDKYKEAAKKESSTTSNSGSSAASGGSASPGGTSTTSAPKTDSKPAAAPPVKKK